MKQIVHTIVGEERLVPFEYDINELDEDGNAVSRLATGTFYAANEREAFANATSWAEGQYPGAHFTITRA